MVNIEKDEQALELWLAGHTYDSISQPMGYADRSAPYRAVMRRLKSVFREGICDCDAKDDRTKTSLRRMDEIEVLRASEMSSN